jgi:hypothetical protein
LDSFDEPSDVYRRRLSGNSANSKQVGLNAPDALKVILGAGLKLLGSRGLWQAKKRLIVMGRIYNMGATEKLEFFHRKCHHLSG